MVERVIEVEVAFAQADQQLSVPIQLFEGANVQQAINHSGILKQFPEIDLKTMKVGVFGKLCDLDSVVEQGDRVEIYRPLMQNPMDARRNRASS